MLAYLTARYPAEPELNPARSLPPAAAAPEGARIAAIGTVAAGLRRSPQLRHALDEAGIGRWDFTALMNLDTARAEAAWDLAIVLSPYKQLAASICDDLSPAAAQTGVVDTLLRTPSSLIGLNTNSFAIEAVIAGLFGATGPAATRVVGTGATARCAVAALLRRDGGTRVWLSGRDMAKAKALAGELGVEADDGRPAGEPENLIIHTTTWGETEESERLPLEPVLLDRLGPGMILFDLNNRVSRLQTGAIDRGATVVGGRSLQLFAHQMRAAMIARR